MGSEMCIRDRTNAVDQANRVLKSRFDFKGTGAEFTLTDNQILLFTKEDFQIKQMEPVLHESLSKRGIDLKALNPGTIEVSNGSARHEINLQEGIDRELGKKITTLVKQSKVKVQASIQGESIRINGKKRDDLQQIMQIIKDQKYDLPLQFNNFRD